MRPEEASEHKVMSRPSPPCSDEDPVGVADQPERPGQLEPLVAPGQPAPLRPAALTSAAWGLGSGEPSLLPRPSSGHGVGGGGGRGKWKGEHGDGHPLAGVPTLEDGKGRSCPFQA